MVWELTKKIVNSGDIPKGDLQTFQNFHSDISSTHWEWSSNILHFDILTVVENSITFGAYKNLAVKKNEIFVQNLLKNIQI